MEKLWVFSKMTHHTYPQWSTESAHAILEPLKSTPGPVLVALQALQKEYGYVDPEAVAIVAQVFNVSRADVHGVLTFYHDLRTTPAPAKIIKICVAEACQSVGSRNLVAGMQKALGVNIDESHVDVEIQSAYCFGNCALGPAAMVDGTLIGRATVEKLMP